jgi:hypothetical protein
MIDMAVLETTKVGEAHGMSARPVKRHMNMNMKTSISFLEGYSIPLPGPKLPSTPPRCSFPEIPLQ